MVSTEMLDKKLRAAEERALAEIQKYGLPTPLDGFGDSLANLENDQRFLQAKGRGKRRILDARNVLLAVREVRERRDAGDIDGAMFYIRYIEHDADLLDHAHRGKGVLESAAEGGRQKASEARAGTKTRLSAWRKQATTIWQKNSNLSATAVAGYIATNIGGNPNTIRRRIRDLKPAIK